MSRSIFGWSFPPGCNGTPFDGPCICQRCGRDAEQDPEKGGCQCPECPECGETGCIDHMSNRELESEMIRFDILADGYRRELRKRYEKNPTICSICKKPLTYEESVAQEGVSYHSQCEPEPEW